MFVDKLNTNNSYRLAIVGLGYVGLPLLCHFATKFQCYGLDINTNRIDQLSKGIDTKKCVDQDKLIYLKHARLTSDWKHLNGCDVFIVTAPTPIDDNNHPDLSCLKDICIQLGKVIKCGSIVVFESTVAPGTTEEICVPIIEKWSSLKLNEGFSIGYSPERINIGDTQHTLSNVPKIVSASNSDTLSIISHLYRKGLGCDVVTASSIKTAEAAKLYENVQRDVLIALANQYSEYCMAEGIDISEVTRCAATKWNFAEVYPGLVGGHCIGVDPYYLISKANEIGVKMGLVEKARLINELETRKAVLNILSRIKSVGAQSILLVGLTYKPNTSDLRNSKALEIVNNVSNNIGNVSIFDPLISKSDLPSNLRYLYCDTIPKDVVFDAVITLVNHSSIKSPQGRLLNMNINK